MSYVMILKKSTYFSRFTMSNPRKYQYDAGNVMDRPLATPIWFNLLRRLARNVTKFSKSSSIPPPSYFHVSWGLMPSMRLIAVQR